VRVEQIAIPAVRLLAKRPRLAHALFRLTNDESPFDLDYSVDPYPSLEAVRAKHGQVYYRKVFRQWFVVGHDEALELLRSPSLSVGSAMDVLMEVRPYSQLSDEARDSFVRWLLFVDPPDHTRLRRLVQRAFTPVTIKAFEPRVRVIADELIAEIADQDAPDVVRSFTSPLPVFAIGELLGLPSDRWAWLKAASDDITGLVDPLHGFDPDVVNVRVAELNAYFTEVIEQRRIEPRDDLISVLVTAADDGEQLDNNELLAMLGFLLFAGHETTTGLIGNSLVALAQHPQQRAMLRDRPELIDNAVEELIRFDTSVQATPRATTAPIRVGDVTIPAGQRVAILWGLVNRDVRRWPDADQLRLDRPDPKPLSFGHGIHHCLGASLARMEMRVAIPAFLAAFGDYRIDPSTTEWKRSLSVRGPTVLPISRASTASATS
ncbi:MAG: Cytochrome, partial [Ilumatobacteraceae bacterium]|nr:Cytochrome [Ilumatobacteraceae bacterium]